jgi:hypothetical protein
MFLENYRSSQNFGATFFYGKSYVIISTKNRFGFIVGDFFTNSSGHPAYILEYLLGLKNIIARSINILEILLKQCGQTYL